MAAVRERTRGGAPARVPVHRGDAPAARASAQRDDAPDAPAGGSPGCTSPSGPHRRPARRRAARSRWRPGRCRDRGRRPRLRLRQRAPTARAGAAGLPDRPSAGHERRIRRVHRRWRLRAPRALAARGLGVPRERGLGAPALLDGGRWRTPLRPHGRARAGASGDARLVVRGRRLRPLARRPASERVRMGARGGARGGRARQPRPARLRPRPRRTRSSATAGSGRPASSTATRASSRTPTASTRRSSSARACGCCAARPGPRGRAWRARRSATGTTRSGDRSFPASDA